MGGKRSWMAAIGALALGCGDSGDGSTSSDASDSATATATETVTGTATETMTGPTASSVTDSDSAATGTATDGAKFDVGGETTGETEGVELCKVQDDGDAMGPCENQAPADSFAPEVQWAFTPNDGNTESLTTPLVANLTDDNDDGEIDLCDIPDVIAQGFPLGGGPSTLYVLDGETGALHYTASQQMLWRGCPAVGDIDNDGLPEIVVQSANNTLYALENDGALKWESGQVSGVGAGPCVALGDVDNDGDVEIAFDNNLFDHNGSLITSFPNTSIWSQAIIMVDLDNDDDLELVQPARAFHHDGTMIYDRPSMQGGRHAIADLDMDGEPEIVIGVSFDGMAVLEHDGTIKYSSVAPLGSSNYSRPPAIHDIDGDGIPNYMASTGSQFVVYEPDGTVVWNRMVDDGSGSAGSTAFDFLGDGGAEAMYGDEEFIWAYDSDGTPKVQQPRSSATVVEYPVVADVDNDGSAEIVVPSSHYFVYGEEPNPYPLVQVLRDANDRWIQARRIWNQHTYHVTNVREDSTIPQVEPKHWLQLNTFRTNAQIENGGICDPPG